MAKLIISLILLLSPFATALAAGNGEIKDSAPDRYIVVEGDTLWSIAGRFLKEPWRWPELWKMNQEQIKNPHRIYPGDVIVLDRSAQEARLRLLKTKTVKLSPKVRAEPRPPKPVPTIPAAAIEPFLSRPLVIEANRLDTAPRIVATEESRVAIAAGSTAYAEGITKDKGEFWQVFRRGEALVDPDNNETLGYEAVYLGEARVTRFGDVATLEILRSPQEIYVGDRLVPAPKEVPFMNYMPRAPQKPVAGRIVSAYGGLREIGPNSIVALSRGSRDGLEAGHVLAIHRSQRGARYTYRTEPLYGRTGLGGEAPLDYRSESLDPRNTPLYSRSKAAAVPAVDLPDERYGLVMVFRTFDRASFALVMQATRPVHVLDVVTNP